MSQFKFLLDEHVGLSLKRALIRRDADITVWHIGDAGVPPRGTLDPDILMWCERNGFALVTNNRSTMPVHLRDHLTGGRHVPGVLVLNDDMTIGETVDELYLLWKAAAVEEYADQINYLPVSE